MAGADRAAQIAAGHAFEIRDVLDNQRAVEAELLAHDLHHLIGGIRTCRQTGRIAGRHPRD
jgi:hypothetical protein